MEDARRGRGNGLGILQDQLGVHDFLISDFPFSDVSISGPRRDWGRLGGWLRQGGRRQWRGAARRTGVPTWSGVNRRLNPVKSLLVQADRRPEFLRGGSQSPHHVLKCVVLDLFNSVQTMNQLHRLFDVLPLPGDGVVSAMPADALLDPRRVPAAVAVLAAVRRLVGDSHGAQYGCGQQPQPMTNEGDDG